LHLGPLCSLLNSFFPPPACRSRLHSWRFLIADLLFLRHVFQTGPLLLSVLVNFHIFPFFFSRMSSPLLYPLFGYPVKSTDWTSPSWIVSIVTNYCPWRPPFPLSLKRGATKGKLLLSLSLSSWCPPPGSPRREGPIDVLLGLRRFCHPFRCGPSR